MVKTCHVLRKNSNDLRVSKQESKNVAKTFPSEFNQTQHQESSVKPEEWIEMCGVEVAKINLKARVNIGDLIKSYDDDDLGRTCQELLDEIDGAKEPNNQA